MINSIIVLILKMIYAEANFSFIFILKNNKLIEKKGRLRLEQKRYLEKTLKEMGLKNGYILIKKKNGLLCSMNIKKAWHQRIRNIVFN